VFDVATNPATPHGDATELLGRLLEAHKRRRTVPAGDVAAITGLITSADEQLAIRAIEATAAWRPAGAQEVIAAAATNLTRPAPVRRAAIAALGAISGDGARAALRGIAAASDASPDLRAAAIAALVPQAPDVAAAEAVPFLAASSAESAASDAVFRSFLATKGAADALAKAIASGAAKLSPAVVKAGQQAIGSAGRAEPALAQALEASAAAAGEPKSAAGGSRHAMGGAELDAFVEMVRTKADPTRGEAIYKREALKCSSCHRIGDHGARVGPNLAAIGAASQLDYIIDSLVHPAKNVKEGYNTVVLLTTDGQVVTGIPIARGDEEVVLRDATDREVRVPTASIEEESAGTSLMPAGLVDQLSREELADLVRYLSTLGR
jgi:putative heme-binding domain-containing protein